MPPQSSGGSYNGIGSPPSGQSYNGIGTPPSGQSYNGIGSPPSGQSYNGIGTTPSGQAPYNGVGAAPQQSSSSDQSSAPAAPVKEETMSADMDKEKEMSADKSNDTSTQDQPQQNSRDQGAVEKKEDVQNSAQSVQNDQMQNQNKSNIKDTDKANSALASQMNDKKRNDLDVMTHFTQRSNKVFVEANNKAKEMQNTYMDSEHLLAGLLKDGQIYSVFVDLKIQPQIIEQELIKIYKKEKATRPPQISPRIKRIVDSSLIIARKMGYEFISPEHLLLALFEDGENLAARVLVKLGLKKEDLNKKLTGKKEGLNPKEDKLPQRSKSALEQYCIDLTGKAADGLLDPVVERSDVIERVVHILSRRIKNNPALIGEPGVGKTAVVEGLAERIVAKQVPESLLNKRILQLDLSSVVAGASHRGEFEERMKNIVDELKASKGLVIMFIDEMHTMMGAGSGEGAIDASNFIKPALARGEVQFIGATTITEYRKYIEKDQALERRFQPVVVPEPSAESAVKMLKAARSKYEAFHKVKIPDEIIEMSVKLSKRYIGDRFLPDKAFDLMDEAGAAVRLPLISLPEEIKSLEERIAQLTQEVDENEKNGEKVKARILRSKIDDIKGSLKDKKDEFDMKKASTTTEVTPEIIKDIIAKRTGIPLSKITMTEGDKLVKMEDIIHKRMIDQERAVESVAQAVRRGRARLKSNTRPIGSFVFLGPTGVGKTELAKTLAEVLFDEEDAIIRFDMTEYMERHEVAKLIGPPPGYIGFEEGGKLTEAVRRKPYSVILFDEVEKAHPDIFNILLQILDDARLTDNKGRTISFKNTVVICTSNIGTKMIQDELLKSGKTDVTEPTMLSTYVFTPRGREILTMGNKYFERDGGAGGQAVAALDTQKDQNPTPAPVPNPQAPVQTPQVSGGSWVDHILSDYFAGQKTEGKVLQDMLPQEENPEGKELTQEEEEKKSEEQNQQGYNKDSMKQVTFPVYGYDTHAISPQGTEVVTKGNVVYTRSATTAKVWNVTNLIEYFKDQIVVNALPDAPDEQLPTVRLKTHAYTPDEHEIVTYKDRYWRRKANSQDWETGTFKDYFKDQTVKDSTFPTTHWDIHTFSPTGREVVIVGTDIWYREGAAPNWTKQTLHDYFGSNFPLDHEVEEKQKAEEENDKKKYQLIKDKVMNELLRFFRPELVNRFDEVIVFEPLKFVHMIEIVKLQLKALSKLLEEQEIGFSATDVAVKEIVRSGFDPIYGARPLKRAIQKLIENPISELIIAKKLEGGDTLIVDYNGEEFVFNVEHIDRKAGAAEKSQDTPKSGTQTKMFMCEVCANKFKTEVVKNSTPICSICASPKLQEYTESSEQALPGAEIKKEETTGDTTQESPKEPMTPQNAASM
jgi:ATP-dependent Clp protease ATP-binding subunit ClpC